MARWAPHANPQVFDINVEGWTCTIILDPNQTLSVAMRDQSGHAGGVQISTHAASRVCNHRFVRYIAPRADPALRPYGRGV